MRLSGSIVRLGRWGAVMAFGVGYALLAHHTNTAAGVETLGTLVALAPLACAALSFAWHARRRVAALAMLAAICVALAAAWRTVTHYYGLIYWLEHAGTEAILGLTFGRTLVAGREPMCTYFARVVHGSLTPALAHYSRQVTVAWVGFFFLMAATSTVLFFAAPLPAWSAFANFFTAPLIAAMFVIEYVVRRALHPQMEHAHILAAVKAFWNVPAG